MSDLNPPSPHVSTSRTTVWQRLCRWFAALPVRDPIARPQAALLQLLLLAMLLILVPMLLLTVVMEGTAALTLRELGSGLFLVLCTTSAWALLRHNRLGWAVGVVCGAILLVEAQTVVTTGLAHNAHSLIVLVLPTTLAGLVGGRRPLLLVSGLSVALLLGAAPLQRLHVPLLGSASAPHHHQLGGLVVSFIVVIALLGLFLDRFGLALRTALGAAEQRAQELQQEIAGHHRTEAALRQSEGYFRALSERATDLVRIVGADATIHYASPSHQGLLGYTPAALLGRSVMDLIHPEDVPDAWARVQALAHDAATVVTYTCRMRHADGSWRWHEVVASNHVDDPAIRGYIVNARDITERWQAEEALRHQALHDALTDLPNRSLLHDRLEQALRLSQRRGDALALLLLDLDRFKEVNDTFGHAQGDLLLQQVAARLRGAVRASDTVARLGGDEFALLLPGADGAGACQVVQTVQAALEQPVLVEGQPVFVGASVGIAVAPTHGTAAAPLLRCADVAMYVAKRAGSGAAVYDAGHDQHCPERLALVAALRHAITHDDLLLHYQPKVDIASAQVCGVEALVRWRHPERGLIPPDQFIPLAEQTGLIAPLTDWVLEEALRQCQAWQRRGLLLDVAVNLSMWNLRDPRLPDLVAALLQRYSVSAARLRLELTESSIMADAAHSLDVLARLAARGVTLSVDDFGTGYSSLAYLKRLPVDELKIDRSFVQHMAEEETDAAIVASTISLGHSLGLRVVAEGVEDERAWTLLRRSGCDAAQGYYLSRPLPVGELECWLRATAGAPLGRYTKGA